MNSVLYLAKDETQLFLQLISDISSSFSVVLLAAAMLSACVSCRNTFKTETCHCWDSAHAIVKGDWIVEYEGELLDEDISLLREAEYSKDASKVRSILLIRPLQEGV